MATQQINFDQIKNLGSIASQDSGSVNMTGSMSGSFSGDGSQLTGISGGGGGFPDAQVVYLDKNGANSGNSFTTFQGAYNAADALAATDKVSIIVGAGSAVDFGNCVLTAPWNPNVSLTGLGAKTSVVGNIDGTNLGAGVGYSVDIKIHNVGVGTISCPATDGSSADGFITVEGQESELQRIGGLAAGSTIGAPVIASGVRVVGTFDPNFGVVVSVTSGGNITLADCQLDNSIATAYFLPTLVTATRCNFGAGINCNANGDASDAILTDCTVVGAIDLRGDGPVGSGDATLTRSTVGGISVLRGGTGGSPTIAVITLIDSLVTGTAPIFGASVQLCNQGLPACTLKMQNSRVVGPILGDTLGSTSPATIFMLNSHVEGYFDRVNSTSIFTKSTIRNSSGGCINDIDASGPTIIDCTLESADTVSNEISAASPVTIVAHHLLLRVGLHANVALSEGTSTQSTNIKIPSI